MPRNNIEEISGHDVMKTVEGLRQMLPWPAAAVGHNIDEQMFCERPDGKTASGHIDCVWPEDHLQETTVVASASGRQS